MSDFRGPCNYCGAPVKSVGPKVDLPPQFDPAITRDHLNQLRLLIEKAGSLQDKGPWGEGWQSAELESAIKSAGELADCIEALLPPEK